MPWYRVYAHHGPGHQSSSEHYRYFENPLTADQKADVWDDCCGRLYDAIGDVKLVEALPEHILASKIESAKNAIKYNERLLEVLATTESQPVIAVRFELPPVVHEGKRHPGLFRARLLNKAEVSAVGKTRDIAVKNLLKILKVWWRPTPTKKTFAIIVR